MKAIIFHDFVHQSGPLYDALQAIFGRGGVAYVNADDVNAGILNDLTTIFVMPGGASRYGVSKLRGRGFRAIRRYVEDGGAFLGICGGAYTACARTRWAVGTRNEITNEGELCFFSADAVGPIDEFSTARNRDGADARLVRLETDGETVRSLYWGGSRFLPHPGAEYTVCARFADLPDRSPAVVGGVCGRGRWLLSSPHIEVNAAALRLMTFDVVDNRYEDITALGDASDVTTGLFDRLVNNLIRKPV